MCIIKKSSAPIMPVVKKEPVIRHQADASLTKSSQDEYQSFLQNDRYAALKLTDEAETRKKTLLGE